MRTNHLKAGLKAGKTYFGAWLVLPSPHATRFVAHMPFDWLMVDTEHAPIDNNTMTQMVGIIADANGPAPFVRVSFNTAENIKRALDSGSWGVLVPMVNTAAEAQAAVRNSLYPPQGERSFGGMYASTGFNTDRPTYTANANEQVIVAIQIESQQAIDNCEEILAVPGIDLAFIGPNDLHGSLGLAPRNWSDEPVFLAAVARVKAAATKNNIPLGIFASTGADAANRAAEGFQFVNLAIDAVALQQGLTSQLEAAKQPATPAPAKSTSY